MDSLLEPFQDLNLLFYIGLLFIVSQVGGRIAHYLKAPRVTGYLVIGILVGPYVLNLFTEELITSKLGLIEDIALSIIAFSIGGSLERKNLVKAGKDIRSVTILQSTLTFLVVTATMLIFMWLLKINGSNSLLSYMPIAFFFGAISVATAPAAILAIIEEFKAKGNMTTILLGTVAIDDAITILIFSFVENLYSVFTNGDPINFENLMLDPLTHIITAIAIGVAIGYIMKFVSRYLISKATMLGVALGAILMTGGLALTFHVSVILAVMALGFVAVNTVRHHHGLFVAVDRIEEPIFGMFFLIAGAHLNISLLFSAGLAAVVITLSRFAGKYFGAYLGASFSGATPDVKKYLGLALLPQAGVAIALVFEATQFIHDLQLSQFLITTILASIVINELITPFLVKYALVKSGDIKSTQSE